MTDTDTKMIGHLRSNGRGYQARAKAGGTGEILLYDEIGEWGITAKQVAQDLKEIGPVSRLDVRIHSMGGEIIHGLAIFNLLKRHAAHVVVHVDGVAASMASAIAMSGDEIVIAENAYLVVHNPVWGEWGEADDLRETADLLDRFKANIVNTYVDRTGLDAAKVETLMARETWLDSHEAVELGFADRIDKALKMAAHIDPARLRGFARVPDRFTQPLQPPEDRKMPATYQELKAALPEADAQFLCAQLEAKAEIDVARAAFQKHEVDTARAESAQAKAESAQAKADSAQAKAEADKAKAEAKAAEDRLAALAKAPGVDPVGDGKGGGRGDIPGDQGDALAAFQHAIDGKLKTGLSRPDAMRAVAKEQPEVHAAYVEAHNDKVGPSNYRGRRG